MEDLSDYTVDAQGVMTQAAILRWPMVRWCFRMIEPWPWENAIKEIAIVTTTQAVPELKW